MNLGYQVAGLNLPSVKDGDKTSQLLTSALGKKCILPKLPKTEAKDFFWKAEYFNLDRVTLFQTATEEEKREILKLCSQNLLAETYLVEQAGVGYMAKMVLLADSVQERTIYALFAADEASHLATFQKLLPQIKVHKNAFSSFLSDFLETQDKAALLLIVQVILEGWGLTHYRSLAKECLDANITQMYGEFLQAEARHHAMGLTYFQNNSIGDRSSSLAEVVSSFLSLIQAGPVSVVEAIQAVKGNLSTLELIKLLTELDAENHSSHRLNLLRRLIQQAGAISLIEILGKWGCFQAFTVSQSANLILQS